MPQKEHVSITALPHLLKYATLGVCVHLVSRETRIATNQCTDIDECLVQPCLNGATCTNLINNYACNCALGFKGHNCDQLNNCEPNPCQNGATCVDFDIGFICECVRGWDETLCDNNIDNCTANSCLNGGMCMDLVDDFQCSYAVKQIF